MQFLTECLDSILCQTYPKIEIIVVDDGSTDRSLEVAHRFETRGVNVIAQKNGGQSRALNTAFAAAKGDYLQYLDADDVLDNRKIEMQMARLAQADSMAIAAGAWARFESSVSKAIFVPERIWRDLTPVDWLVESWKGGGMMHVAGWLIPRRVVEAAGPWPESLRRAPNIDADFFTRALLASSGCLFCVDAKSYYRAVPGSQSSLRSRDSLEAMLHVLVRTGEDLLRIENSVRTRSAFADNLQRFVYAVYPDCRDLITLAERRIEDLGGSHLQFTAGRTSLVLAGLFGWKPAKQLRRCARVISQR
jgi:glycosyltransferase involved in cell wall biosynthesis